MRDIVFRGKDVIGGAWLCGDLVHTTTGKAPMIRVHCENGARNFMVDPESIGQFTGLNDRNGRRIFEGDVIRVRCGLYENVGTVIYSENNTRFGIVDRRGETNFSFLHKPFVSQFAIEVIGFAHDNPELLKEDGNA